VFCTSWARKITPNSLFLNNLAATPLFSIICAPKDLSRCVKCNIVLYLRQMYRWENSALHRSATKGNGYSPRSLLSDLASQSGHSRGRLSGYCPSHSQMSLSCWDTLPGDIDMRSRIRFSRSALPLLFSLAFIGVSNGAQPPKDKSKDKSKVVYVCACLQTRSCSCMTEAKMEGPCACGTQGGPPLKAVPADSDWAKENREELAK